MSDLHHRRSIRLHGYDYAQAGAYFVTICAHQRAHVFGQIVDEAMVITAWGQVVQTCWDDIPVHFPQVELDAFVVMPNHIHGIIVIIGDMPFVGAQYIAPLRPPSPIPPLRPPSAPLPPSKRGATPNNVAPNSLGSIVRTFKAAVTRQILRLPDPPDHPIWQRNYYEHVIRDEDDLNRIREYIQYNPARWSEDDLYG